MKMLVQRVKHAKVTVDGNVTGAIEQGYLVLLGIAPEDTTEIMEKWWTSCCGCGFSRTK